MRDNLDAERKRVIKYLKLESEGSVRRTMSYNYFINRYFGIHTFFKKNINIYLLNAIPFMISYSNFSILGQDSK